MQCDKRHFKKWASTKSAATCAGSLALAAALVVVGGCTQKTLSIKSVNTKASPPAVRGTEPPLKASQVARLNFKSGLKGLRPAVQRLGEEVANALVPDTDSGAGARALEAILASLRKADGSQRSESEIVAILEFAKRHSASIVALSESELGTLTAFLGAAASANVLGHFDARVLPELKGKGTDDVASLVAAKVAEAEVTPAPQHNTAPNAPTSVTLLPESFNAASTLTCAYSGGSDAQNDPMTPVFTWYKNGALLQGASQNTLPPGSFAKGDILKCAVALGDASLLSSFTESSAKTAGNRAPASFTTEIASSANRRGGTFSCSATPPTDPDGDPVGAATYRWLQNGAVIPNETTSSFTDSGNILLKGNSLTCEMSFSDGTATTNSQASLTVGNSDVAITECRNASNTVVAAGGDLPEVALSSTTTPRLTCTATDPDSTDTLSWRTFGCMDRYTVNSSGEVRIGAQSIAAGESCSLHVVVSDGSSEARFYAHVITTVPNTGEFEGLTSKNSGTIRTMLPIPEPSTLLKDSRYVAVGGEFEAVGNFTLTGKTGKVKFNPGAVDPDPVMSFQANWQSVTSWRTPRAVSKLPNGTILYGGDIENVSAPGDPLSIVAHPQGLLHTTEEGSINTAPTKGLHATSKMGLHWDYGVKRRAS